MAIEYAMYRGDEFIDIGTIDELEGLKDIYGKYWHKVGNKNERN